MVFELGRRSRLFAALAVVPTVGSVVRTRSLDITASDETSLLTLNVGGVYLLVPLFLDLSVIGLGRSRDPAWEVERVWFRDDILTLGLT